ncbi:hypothetical protein [Clostridium cochlearium]|uniref:hypothetical protein n=1 Tax=Clostridium cochlearium TaxID=1494 RepID=UPI00241C7B93|nr:hypothetical protein [Clostridium cochlearium]MBE6065898.1 hypothetical protein [Clostridium cochlearium]
MPPKTVKIEYMDFINILHILEHIDTSDYEASFRENIDTIIYNLRYKKEKLELRNTYTRLIMANEEDDTEKAFDAKIEYLKQKRRLI